MKKRIQLNRTRLTLIAMGAAIAIAIPSVALSYSLGSEARIETIRDRGSSTLGYVQMEGWSGWATDLYYFGPHGTCASVPGADLSEGQLNRLVQAQANGMLVTPIYETGAWGGYKCLTGFDLTATW